MFFVAMTPCPEDPLERAEELYLGRLATTAAESFSVTWKAVRVADSS
jgi:hypothetical protein